MEHVETIPETNDILSSTIITLFGILSPPCEKEECHFCLETITKGQFMVFKLPCCRHYPHTECFKTWASSSHTESTVHCAYWKTRYQYEDMFPLLTRIHRETQPCNMLPHKSSLRMRNRPCSSTLAPNLRSLTGMRTTR